MLKPFSSAAFAAALAVGAMTVSTPADARGRYHHRGGGALAAGIVGLAVGAAIASDGPYYPAGYYYGPPPDYYYGPPRGYYYGYPDEYYYRPYPHRYYYHNYYPHHYYRGVGRVHEGRRGWRR